MMKLKLRILGLQMTTIQLEEEGNAQHVQLGLLLLKEFNLRDLMVIKKDESRVVLIEKNLLDPSVSLVEKDQ